MRIWKSGSPKEKSYLWLKRDVAAVICLWAAGIRDQRVFEDNVSVRNRRKFVEQILASKDPVIVACKLNPPPELRVTIKDSLRCKGCGSQISVLPCVHCALISGDAVYIDFMSGFVAKPTRPTTHLPGSPGKIAVLSERLARNEELWHEDDAKPRNQSAVEETLVRKLARLDVDDDDIFEDDILPTMDELISLAA